MALAILMLATVAPAACGAAPSSNPDLPAEGARIALPSVTEAIAPAVRTAEPAGIASTWDDSGGDDVVVGTAASLRPAHHPVAIASDGTIFAAVSVSVDAYTAYILVLRSTDGGSHWSAWGTLGGSTDLIHASPAMHVAEGTQDRLFVAYVHRPRGGNASVRVARTPLAATPTWSDVAALAAAGVDFDEPSLDSDAITYADYALYLAAQAEDGDGRDVWFTRSGDFGASWSAGYRIASLSLGTRDYMLPEVRYGFGGVVHCVWAFSTRDGTADRAVRYRRALNRAVNGVADWQTTVYITQNNDGRDEWMPTVAACYVNNWMVLGWENFRPDGLLHGTGLRASYDAGATWPAAYQDSLPFHYEFGVRAKPGLEGFAAVARRASENVGVLHAGTGTPLSWSEFSSLSDRSYSDGLTGGLGDQFALDPTHGSRVAVAWDRIAVASADTLFFDAEWRGDPGWPNLEPGMPMALPADVVSPPAVCELDGDQESEIVFGDELGYVRAYNHDGTVVPGWPKAVGTMPDDSPVAVGDLNGDGRNEVVVATLDGAVIAFHHDGTVVWAYSLGTGAGAGYVSLGALLPDSPLQVVVASGTRIWVIRYDGSVPTGWPQSKVTTFSAPAAIGDVDDDGTNEIVQLFGGYMNVTSPTASTEHYRNLTAAGKTFPNAPTLADLDLDGDLEIVAPTAQGDVYVFHHDGTDMAGWPWTEGGGLPITSVALANVRAGPEPELLFAVEDAATPRVYCLWHDGEVYSGWPTYTGAGWYVHGMPIVEWIDDSPSYLAFVGSRDTHGYAWNNFGDPLEGWPLGLGGRSSVSPASGDLDADGRLEVVFVTEDPPRLAVVDLGSPMLREVRNYPQWWPMYGYNPMRQGCQECGTGTVTGVPGEPAAVGRLRFDLPLPNPAGGPQALRFALPARAPARLDVFDVNGRRVRTLLREELDAGPHEVVWDGCDRTGARAAAGVYHVRLDAANWGTLTRKLVRLP